MLIPHLSNYLLIYYSQGGSDTSNKATEVLPVTEKWSISVALQYINISAMGRHWKDMEEFNTRDINRHLKQPEICYSESESLTYKSQI